MKWPWETKKPVHDPTRNYDIHTINVPGTWLYPTLPLYTFPDNFWCQILLIKIRIDGVAGIRGRDKVYLRILRSEEPFYFNVSNSDIGSSKINRIVWAPSGGHLRFISATKYDHSPLADHLYAFPGDQIDFIAPDALPNDLFRDLTIVIKRWEYY